MTKNELLATVLGELKVIRVQQLAILETLGHIVSAQTGVPLDVAHSRIKARVDKQVLAAVEQVKNLTTTDFMLEYGTDPD